MIKANSELHTYNEYVDRSQDKERKKKRKKDRKKDTNVLFNWLISCAGIQHSSHRGWGWGLGE